jgi:hypothetical protein
MTYRTGFIGATTEAATAWVGSQVEDAKRIIVPFAGSGRDIQSMAGPERTIVSWDTQHYSAAIVNGVFAAKSVETNVDKIRYRKGWTYENRPIKNIDERCAGFIDWVADEGTLFDHACMASAIVRSTLMGRMTQWYANVETLYKRFLKAREYNSTFIGQPGEFVHYEGSVYDDFESDAIKTDKYDLMQVDPPKIVVGGDVYSANFDFLNKALHGTVEELPKWNWRDSLELFRKLIIGVHAERVVFLYVSGVRPAHEDVRAMLEQYGTIEEEKAFDHRGRTDYGIVLRRDA